MAETTHPESTPAPVDVSAWTEAPVAPREGSTPTRVLLHRRIPEAVVQLARERVTGGPDVDAYADRQVAALDTAARLVDRRVIADGRHLRLVSSLGGRPVTTDLLVRVRGGAADLCVVTRASARDPELLEDVAEVVDAWAAS